jgi:hypothetical protein
VNVTQNDSKDDSNPSPFFSIKTIVNTPNTNSFPASEALKIPPVPSVLDSSKTDKHSTKVSSSPVKYGPKELSQSSSTSRLMSSSKRSDSESGDLSATYPQKRFEVRVSASESETERRSRISGIDYTIVHKESGKYKKIEASDLRSVIRSEIMRNLTTIKSPLNAQARKLNQNSM